MIPITRFCPRLTKTTFLAGAAALLLPTLAVAREFHVAKTGTDANSGETKAPFLTISKAAQLAQPGDVVTVHAGILFGKPRNSTHPLAGPFEDIRDGQNRYVIHAGMRGVTP